MKHVLHTCTFVGIDEDTRDEKVTLSYLKSGGVTLCIHKADAIIFHATIPKESWENTLESFSGLT